MSEPNSPLTPQAESGLESSLNWWNPFPELTESGSEQAIDAQKDQSSFASQEAAANPDTAPVVARIEISRASDRSQSVSQDQPAEPTEPPNLTDLISLIQELNQCNGVLLDRVSQLEDALERSQQSLQGQPPESAAFQQADDPAAAQAQIANLFSQLEFAHQTIQRQHILVETLTAELESSQERVAQLEREAALLQQRYSEQTQILVQSEGTCRDLQARLQRQQRYTLQFKAALEKCLEMPMPQSEAGGETIVPPLDSLLLPKAQQIQPWSKSAAPQETLLPWMRRFKAVENKDFLESASSEDFSAEMAVAEAIAAETITVETIAAETIAAETVTVETIAEPVRPDLSAVQLPVLNSLNSTAAESQAVGSQSETQELAEAAIASSEFTNSEFAELGFADATEPAAPEPAASISYDLKPQAGVAPSPDLVKQIDAVVQPLADRLAEALLFQAATAELAEAEAVQQPTAPAPSIESDDISDPIIVADPDSLLASAMSDAEDALWQDLARLIEVSPEEAVKASLTGDLAAFESLNFEAMPVESVMSIEPAALPQPPQPKTEPLQNPAGVKAELPFTPGPIAQPPQTPIREQSVKAGIAKLPTLEHQMGVAAQAPSTPALAANSGSPSPLLHPSRAAKQKRSLSSVELPSFLRQEDSKPLPT